MHLLTIVLPPALATANRITEPGSASDSAHSRHGARRSRASDERLEEPRPPARATMKNYFTHSGKQESREVTITDFDMGTFDYFCNPSIFGKNAGAGQCSKRLASAARGLPLYLWEKCRGRAVQQKIGERYRWGATPLSLAKMQGQGSAVKNWRALPLGATLYLWEKCRGKAVQQKLASATAGGLALYLWEKCRGRAVQQKVGARLWENAGAEITDLDMGTFDYFCNPSIFGKNAGAGQCSKRLASVAGGLPLYLWEKCRGRAVQQKIGERYRWGATPLSLANMQGQGSAVKNWRALPLGSYPSSLGKMQGQGRAAKIGERYRWGATPLSLGKCRGRAVQQKIGARFWENAGAAAGGDPISWGKCTGRAVQ